MPLSSQSQEGCRSTEGHDLRVRVLQQLANIAIDAAQDAMDAATSAAAAAMPSFGSGGGHAATFSPVRSGTSSSSPAVLGTLTPSSSSPPAFLPDKHLRFVQLVNLALHATLKVWMEENIKVRSMGVSPRSVNESRKGG